MNENYLEPIRKMYIVLEKNSHPHKLVEWLRGNLWQQLEEEQGNNPCFSLRLTTLFAHTQATTKEAITMELQ